MKKFLFFLIAAIAILLIPQQVEAQVYQLPNGGFEDWPGNANSEPAHWNAFPSAYCTLKPSFLCGIATETRHTRDEGHSGQYSCKIYATAVIGIVANGALTTGRIHVASRDLDDLNNNNFTDVNNSDFNQTFDGKPDSLCFWAKFSCPNASQKARVDTVIHDSYNMTDPYSEGDKGHIVGTADALFTQTNNQWKRIVVPVVYDGFTNNDPQYILFNATTNKDPGQGSAQDFLWLDDIEMIYNADLKTLSSGQQDIKFYNKLIYYIL